MLPTHFSGQYRTSPHNTEIKFESTPTPMDLFLAADGARFFVIKSFTEEDIYRSIKHGIWCSTFHGNKRLDDAWRERKGKGPVYLFFSANGTGSFCGMAEMISAVDHETSAAVWCQNKWKGQFKVRWTKIKDVPNQELRHILLENNENKPVTKSRDTQEIPHEQGKQVLRIFHYYKHVTSIFYNFGHYAEREAEQEGRALFRSAQNAGRGRSGAAHNDREQPSDLSDSMQNDNIYAHRPEDECSHQHSDRDHGAGMPNEIGYDRNNFGGPSGGFDEKGGPSSKN